MSFIFLWAFQWNPDSDAVAVAVAVSSGCGTKGCRVEMTIVAIPRHRIVKEEEGRKSKSEFVLREK